MFVSQKKSSRFVFRFWHLAVMRLWTSHLTLWSLNDFMCKVGIIMHTSPGFERLRETMYVKVFGKEESSRKKGGKALLR